jgi:Stage II sporulation protein E (SpoIIE)
MLPQGLDRRTIVLLAFALPFVIAANLAQAQVFDLEHDRVPMAELHGLWRFHTGDDPDGKLGWAQPGFDDSSWKLLRSDQPWEEQGYKGYSGMAWYRFHVVLPTNHSPMSLYIPGIANSYQVFAGGQLIGQFGGLPPHERVLLRSGPGQLMPIPAGMDSGDGAVTFAIRVWNSPRYLATGGGGPSAAVRIGDAGLLSEWNSLQFKDWFWSDSANGILLLGFLLGSFAGLGLYLLRPSERVYLWFSAYELMSTSIYAGSVYLGFHPAWDQGYLALLHLCGDLAWGICLTSFLVALLKARKRWMYWIAIASAVIASLSQVFGVLASLSFARLAVLALLAWLPFQVCLLLLLYFPARRGNLDARLLLGPNGLGCVTSFAGSLVVVFESAGYTWATVYQQRFDQLFTWPFPVSVGDLVDFLCQISILAILVLRFARTRRDEERQASELEAARVVQRVLVPADVPAIPGFRIQSVYKPAGQVGGDFFQIIPLPSGGVLVAIGDVSGKGMPAAMMVSLLVGRLQALAEASNSPAEILKGLNRGLHVRSRGGFTTCLILRADPDGTLMIANAGHIAPYRNGVEMSVENGFPLGVSEDATYSESTFRLDENDQLTLVTDGVVEARGKDGELFGFARTQAISKESAEGIAQVAQSFGQDDDISVISVTRTTVIGPALA